MWTPRRCDVIYLKKLCFVHCMYLFSTEYLDCPDSGNYDLKLLKHSKFQMIRV